MATDTPQSESAMLHAEPSLLEILAYYAQAGFAGDAHVTDDGDIHCATCSSRIPAHRVDVHSMRRLEGVSDPDDMVGVIAIICPDCGAHSTAVLKYGPSATEGEVAAWHHTRDLRADDAVDGHMAPGEDDPAVQPQLPLTPDDV